MSVFFFSSNYIVLFEMTTRTQTHGIIISVITNITVHNGGEAKMLVTGNELFVIIVILLKMSVITDK